MKCALKMVVALVAVIFVCRFIYKHSGIFQYAHNPLQYMPNMHHTKALIPQRGYDFFPDHAGVRVPPAGTLAKTQQPYPYAKTVPATDVPKYSNPTPISREVVLRGQKVFMTTCVVCHGPSGLGNGYVVPPFPQPPSLQSDKIRGYADSQIFHVISVGQNSMGSYAPQIREEDRWAVIHYIRVLQISEKPSEEDLKAFDSLIQNTKGGQP